MGTNCAPLLADLFLYSYEAEFIQQLLKDGKKNVAKNFNFTFRYIDDVLSINNNDFQHICKSFIHLNLKLKIRLSQVRLPLIWIYFSKQTIIKLSVPKFMTSAMISTFL